MIAIFERFKFRKSDNKQSPIKKKTSSVKSRKTSQARRNNDQTAIELQWIQHCLTWVSGHRKSAVLVMLLMVMMTTPMWIARTQWLPIERIVLNGAFEQISMKQLENELQPFLGQGFFSVNIQQIQQRILSQPWVENVSVRRVWPNQLKVSVMEKTAVARWDDSHLMSSRGTIYQAQSSDFEHLPKIHGYQDNSLELLQRFQQLQQRFMTVGLSLAELSEDRKGATSLTLDQGLKVNLGSDDNDIKISHFLAVYSNQIKPKSQHIETIDFRYSNGFAIAWKDEYLKQQKAETQKRGNRNV